jgi:hypothetical protein
VAAMGGGEARADRDREGHLSWGQGQNGQLGSFILIKRNTVANESMGRCYNVIVKNLNVKAVK